MGNPLALIIEDDPNQADIFSISLEHAEFDTEIFQNGGLALARLKKITPALVVLDLHLPQVSGGAILNYIRAEERFNQTRIILATADPAMADPLRDSSDVVLIKPISFSQLRDLASRLRPLDTIMPNDEGF